MRIGVQQGLIRVAGSALALGAVAGVYALYRWAEPGPPPSHTASFQLGKTVAVRMVDAFFENRLGDRPTWSVHAAQIDLERLAASGSATQVQSATIQDIKDGKLYDLPGEPPQTRKGNGPIPASTMPGVTFSARRGRYAAGVAETLPVELQGNYALQWQFELTDGAVIRTRAGDALKAQTITVMELRNRRTLRLERRLLCSDGAQITTHGVRMVANQARFNPDTRQVECLGGVRGTMNSDSLQAERLFWSLPEGAIRCPETATGTLQGAPFEATNLTVDTKRQRFHAAELRLHLPSSLAAPGLKFEKK